MIMNVAETLKKPNKKKQPETKQKKPKQTGSHVLIST